jgi:hypothetical protein
MPESDKYKPDLPGPSGKAATGKEKANTPDNAQPADAALHARRASRRVKVREDVDPDYAEEAEDFFYGEGR